MGPTQAVLAIIGGLIVVAGFTGGLYAYAKAGAQDAIIERLRGERDDLLSRLNFIEPRFAAAEEQNKILKTLTDPSEGLKQIGDQVNTKAEQITMILERQSATLADIQTQVHVPRRSDT